MMLLLMLGFSDSRSHLALPVRRNLESVCGLFFAPGQSLPEGMPSAWVSAGRQGGFGGIRRRHRLIAMGRRFPGVLGHAKGMGDGLAEHHHHLQQVENSQRDLVALVHITGPPTCILMPRRAGVKYY